MADSKIDTLTDDEKKPKAADIAINIQSENLCEANFPSSIEDIQDIEDYLDHLDKIEGASWDEIVESHSDIWRSSDSEDENNQSKEQASNKEKTGNEDGEKTKSSKTAEKVEKKLSLPIDRDKINNRRDNLDQMVASNKRIFDTNNDLAKASGSKNLKNLSKKSKNNQKKPVNKKIKDKNKKTNNTVKNAENELSTFIDRDNIGNQLNNLDQMATSKKRKFDNTNSDVEKDSTSKKTKIRSKKSTLNQKGPANRKIKDKNIKTNETFAKADEEFGFINYRYNINDQLNNLGQKAACKKRCFGTNTDVGKASSSKNAQNRSKNSKINQKRPANKKVQDKNARYLLAVRNEKEMDLDCDAVDDNFDLSLLYPEMTLTIIDVNIIILT